MLTFHKIQWKNLLSTGNYWTQIELNKNQNTLIVGKNGNGKSQLLDAICFVLFGKPFRNINKGNLVNSINQKDLIVEIEFTTDNKSYKIIRGIKPNVFEIYCDKKLLNQDAASKDYQDYLEKSILKLNYKSFTQIVILGSASFTPFMQLSAGDRRAIIEDLLDIQIFSTMNAVFKEKLSINKEATTQKKYELDLLNQKYEMQKKHLESIEQNNEAKIKELISEINTNTKSTESLIKDITKYSEKIGQLQEVVSSKSEIQDTITKITKLESQIETNVSKFKKDISLFTEHDQCPTCKQHIDSDFKQNELLSLNSKVEENEQALKLLETRLLDKQNEMNFIVSKEKEVHNLQVKIATNNASISQIKKYIDRLNKQITDLKTVKAEPSKEDSELKNIESDINKANSELKTLLEEKTYIDIALTLLKDTGIKTKIIRQYLPVINKLVNKYLSSLDFFVNFNLDESFKETIKSRHRDDFVYNNFSEGEKQKINLSILFAWREIAKLKNSAYTNLLIMDEVFDSSLDANGTECLMSILSMFNDTNIFVISHKGDALQDKFVNIIKFDKVSNFSKIVL